MKSNLHEDTPRVVALAVAFFGALAALGWADGVFARLGDEIVAALALFALAFAVASYVLDSHVRAWLHRLLRFRSTPAKSPGAKRAAF